MEGEAMENKYDVKEALTGRKTVTLHAGALNTPDNTVESVKAAIDYGAELLEIDVSFRPDGTPVMIHKGNPTADEGVLLEEGIEVLATSKTCMVNLDLKSTSNLPAVDALIEKYDLCGRAFYTGVGSDWVETVKANSKLPYYLNYFASPADLRNPESAAKKAVDAGAIGMNCNYHFANKKFVDCMRKNGLLVSLWTVNTKFAAFRVRRMDPDNTTTRNPGVL